MSLPATPDVAQLVVYVGQFGARKSDVSQYPIVKLHRLAAQLSDGCAPVDSMKDLPRNVEQAISARSFGSAYRGYSWHCRLPYPAGPFTDYDGGAGTMAPEVIAKRGAVCEKTHTRPL